MLTSDKLVREATIVVCGVDTHRDTHYAAVLDLNGVTLGTREFTADGPGYRALLEWVACHGLLETAGVELTGSYGAGLTRYLTAAGVTVVDVNTTDKATRARRGKDDVIDAVAAAQKVLAGMATVTPKDTTGVTEAIRVLTNTRDLAVKQRTETWNVIHATIVTAPEQLRGRLRDLTRAALLTTLRSLRPDTSRLTDPHHAVKHALKRLADRLAALDQEIAAADTELTTLTTQTAPTLLARPGIGVHTAARFLITVASNGGRIHSEAALARMTGAAPIPVSSGKTHRMRLHRGGDRQANRLLHMVIVGRLRHDPRTKQYLTRRTTQGLSKRDIIRALKRYLIREIYTALKTDGIIT